MKRIGMMAVACGLLSAGCVHMEQTLTIKDDASGTYDCVCSVPEETLMQFRAAAKIKQELARTSGEKPAAAVGVDYVDLFLFEDVEKVRKELASLKKYTITVSKLKVENREGRRLIELSVKFQNLAEVAKAEFFREYGFSLIKNKDGDYVMQRPPLNKEKTDIPDMSDPDNLKLLTPLLGGFFVQAKVNTPSAILRTNAQSKSSRTAMWTFDFDNKPAAFVAIQNEGLGLVFEGKKLKLPEIPKETLNFAK